MLLPGRRGMVYNIQGLMVIPAHRPVLCCLALPDFTTVLTTALHTHVPALMCKKSLGPIEKHGDHVS